MKLLMRQDPQADAFRRAIRKINTRVLPFLFFVIFASFLDRTNLSFAALEMRPALSLNASMFGFGAGVLFLGETLFAVPSTLAARRWGVHRWIPVIMCAWGLLAALMAAVSGSTSFMIARFLLGAAEAGAMPCILAAAAIWWPASHRARAITVITAASGVAIGVAAPLGAALSSLKGMMGLSGWQWMFIAEGLPVAASGVAAWFAFPRDPTVVTWLSDDEKAALSERMSASFTNARGDASAQRPTTQSSGSYIALAAIINFCVAGTASTLIFWIPQVAQEGLGIGLEEIGRILSPLFLIGIVGAYYLSRWSDQSAHRYPFILGCATVSLALVVSAATGAAGWAFALMSLAFLIVRCIGGVFMAALSEDLSGKAASFGFAIAMVAAGVGQFCGNSIFGVLRDRSGGFLAGLLFLSVMLAVTSIAAAILRRSGRQDALQPT